MYKQGFQLRIGGDGLYKPGICLPAVHVVGHHQAAGTEQRHQFLEIINVAGLIGIQEQEVDGLLQFGYLFMSIPEHQGDPVIHSGPFKIFTGESGPSFINFVGSQFAPGAAQPEIKPGTQELSNHMLAALEHRRACLLGTHGMICYHTDLDRVLQLGVEVEALARQYHYARQNGEPVLLDAAQMRAVLDSFADYGKQPDAE